MFGASGVLEAASGLQLECDSHGTRLLARYRGSPGTEVQRYRPTRQVQRLIQPPFYGDPIPTGISLFRSVYPSMYDIFRVFLVVDSPRQDAWIGSWLRSGGSADRQREDFRG